MKLIKLIFSLIFGTCNHSYGKYKYAGQFGFDDYERKTCTKCGITKQRVIGYNLHEN